MISEVFSHLHPIVVHFPIVMITIALLFDLIESCRKEGTLDPKAGIWLWLIAGVSAWVAVGTGPEEDAFGNTVYLHTHSNLADITAWLATLVVVWRLWMIWGSRSFKQGILAGYLVVSVVVCVLVFSTGYYGGKMVYDDGVGVKVNGNAVNPPHARVHP